MDGISQPTVLLYCFPYSGGSAQIFSGWQRHFPDHVQVRGIELPGHGNRKGEPLIDNYDALAELLAREVASDIISSQLHRGNVHYAFFGHSAGAALGFAVAVRLAKKLQQPPSYCFLSAGLAPHSARTPLSVMSDVELATALRVMAGTPMEILDTPDLLQFILPVVRADFRVYESAVQDSDKFLDCPFTLFAAEQDSVTWQQVWEWSRYTGHPVRKMLLRGDHFSVLRYPEQIISQIRLDIAI